MAGEDKSYIRWVGSGMCCLPSCGQMSGPPHHPRHNVGMGQRAHDHRAVPLCMEHHEDAQQYRLAGMTKEKMREFLDEVAEKLRVQYLQGVNHESTDFPR